MRRNVKGLIKSVIKKEKAREADSATNHNTWNYGCTVINGQVGKIIHVDRRQPDPSKPCQGDDS